jgi:hypothetical protein
MTLSSGHAETQPACRAESVMIIANLGGPVGTDQAALDSLG